MKRFLGKLFPGRSPSSAPAPAQQSLETFSREQRANPAFCAYPFVQISSVPAGFFRPCCYFNRMLRKEDRRNFSLADADLSEIWNSADMREVRQKLLSGEKLKECSQCYSEERVGSTSLRQRSLKEWMDRDEVWTGVKHAADHQGMMVDQPRYLELKPGYLCNIKCRMCNQFDSSQVASELRELAKQWEGIDAKAPRIYGDYHFDVNFAPEQMPNWSEHPAFWSAVEKALPYVETLSFAGGEPTILREVRNLIRKCVTSGHSSHIKVFLSSNFTYVDKELVELAKKFAWFEFIGSIDGYGGIQEYIRFPSQWEVVSSNFALAKKGMIENQLKALVNLTLQMNNVLHFTKLLDWLEELDLEPPHFFHHPYALNILVSPDYLSIDTLPEAGRRIAAQRIEAYIARSEFLRRFPEMAERFELISLQLAQPLPADYRERLTKFWRFTHVIDQQRKQSFAAADPELYAIVVKEMDRLGLSREVPKNIREGLEVV